MSVMLYTGAAFVKKNSCLVARIVSFNTAGLHLLTCHFYLAEKSDLQCASNEIENFLQSSNRENTTTMCLLSCKIQLRLIIFVQRRIFSHNL